MYFKEKSLSVAVNCAIAGATTLGLGSTAAFAQDADDLTAGGAIEEVFVTGSRIARPDIDSASPVTVLTQQDLVVTGVTDIGSLLQRLPSAAGSPIGTTTNNGGDGSVRVDLRGMGTTRTLTLVNGKRTVDGGDYQTIPANMIERVEILKDGASAVYGADAVAGVVNIITRNDFEGLELTAQTNGWDKTNGAEQNTIGLLAGKNFDGGNIVLGVEFIDQEEAYQRDTPWEFMQDSFYIYPAGCENTLTDPYPTGCYRAGSSRIPESRLTFLTQGTFLVGTTAAGPYQAGDIVPHDGRNYNYAPVNYMQTPYERTNVFANANFDINDNLRFKSEFRGNVRTSAQELAPMPYNSPTDPAHAGVFNGTAYNGVHQDNFYLRQAVDRYNARTGAGLIYEPIRDGRRRMIETTRRFTQDVQQFQVDLGLEGEFNDMSWDVYGNRGYTNIGFQDFGQFSGPRLQNALGPSADLNGDGQPECYGDINDPSTIITGCVPFNLFGGGSVDRATGQTTSSSLTQDMINYVQVEISDQAKGEQTQVGANITGSLFELQGGELGWAAGVSYRREEFTFTPDSQKAQGAVTGNTGTGTSGALSNTSVYGEFFAPVFDNGEQSLNIKGGVRWDDFSAFDDDVTWQLGVEFNPIDSVKVRGTAGTVFRAPSIQALFGGLSDSFPTVQDPCAQGGALPPGCPGPAVQLDSQILTRVGGNPNLRPETGDTFTAGLVWTPELANQNLTATVDYWKIDIEDGIGTLGTQNILNLCSNNLNQDACALITRRPGDNSIAQVLNGALNLTEQGAEGIDVEIKWDMETKIGLVEAEVLWTHALERTKTAFDGDPEQDLQGRYTDPTAADGGARPDDKISYSLAWGNENGLTVTYLGEFISGMDGDTVFTLPGDGPNGVYVQDIGTELYHDLVATYEFNENLTISGGVTNLTNESPPFIDTGFNAKTDPATYREFGRGYYLRLKYSM